MLALLHSGRHCLSGIRLQSARSSTERGKERKKVSKKEGKKKEKKREKERKKKESIHEYISINEPIENKCRKKEKRTVRLENTAAYTLLPAKSIRTIITMWQKKRREEGKEKKRGKRKKRKERKTGRKKKKKKMKPNSAELPTNTLSARLAFA
jgi:hypothetical protein